MLAVIEKNTLHTRLYSLHIFIDAFLIYHCVCIAIVLSMSAACVSVHCEYIAHVYVHFRHFLRRKRETSAHTFNTCVVSNTSIQQLWSVSTTNSALDVGKFCLHSRLSVAIFMIRYVCVCVIQIKTQRKTFSFFSYFHFIIIGITMRERKRHGLLARAPTNNAEHILEPVCELYVRAYSIWICFAKKYSQRPVHTHSLSCVVRFVSFVCVVFRSANVRKRQKN